MRRRNFEFVAFWDTGAWVAGTTAYNSVAQGDTLEHAVRNLKQTLWLDAVWSQTDGRKPFSVDQPGLEPMDSFSNVQDTLSVTYKDPSKEERYHGNLIVEWDPKQVLKSVKAKKRKS